MSKMLTTSEVLVAAIQSGMPLADAFRVELEEFTLRMGAALAEHLQVDGPAAADFFVTDDGDGGGVVVGFAPLQAGQPLPDALQPFDKSGDWEPRGRTQERAIAR